MRMRASPVAIISDDLLTDFAKNRLGAQRCSAQYLEALRVVLGNQARAERMGYVLEMNQRVPFAPPKVMRNIIDQMKAAGITYGKQVILGSGRCQVVQCFGRPRRWQPARELDFMDRRDEAENDARRAAATAGGQAEASHPRESLELPDPSEVPF